MSDIDVLVIGAGPTGLTMAIALTQLGLSCRIIDKLAAASDKSKALVVHTRSLEALDTLGVAADIVSRGEPVEAVNFMNRDHLLAKIHTIGLDSPYPFMLCVAQNETEAALTAQLQRLGLAIERSIELISFTQDESEVTAILQHADGQTETVHSRWMVGADGSHSSVRHGLNLSFDGFPYEDKFWLADVYVNWQLEPHQIYNFVADKGSCMAFPIQGNRFRLLGNTPLGGDPNSDPTLAAIQTLVDHVCPSGTELHDPVWLANFKVHHRKVSNYRQGRIFLIGDAAHVHSPAGGQGMNTGIQDAHNLAWKLALTAKGLVQPALLASYHPERNAVGEQVLKTTDRLLKLMTMQNPVARTIRDHALALASTQEGFTDKMKSSLSQLDIAYPDSTLTSGNTTAKGGIPAGERAPEALLSSETPPHTSIRLSDMYRGGKFSLVLLAGANATQEDYTNLSELADTVASNYKDSVDVHIVVAGVVRPTALANWNGSILYDVALALHHRYGFSTTSAYLLRPDGYVGFSSQPASRTDLTTYLARFLIKQPALVGV
jgi:2-polyprenyl-6-methoxyphenol hydroxylase-like FAD-dependent oxidoreductase